MSAVAPPEPAAIIPDAAAAPAPGALGRTLLRGLLWTGGARWAGQLIAWGSTLLVARLLAPADYGIIAMAMVLTGLLELLTDAGLGAALVQAKEVQRGEIEATMGATCLAGAGAALLLGLGAPLWAEIQGDPRLVAVIWTLTLGVLMTAVAAVPYGLLQRRLAFDRIAQAQLVQGLVTAAATLAGAVVVGTYWAIVAGFLTGKLVFTALVLAAEPVSLRIPRRGSGVGRLLRFGGTLTGERLVHYLRSNLDLAIIGAQLGNQALGIYVMSLTLARMPIDKLGGAFAPVAYPVFSRLQGDVSELKRYFLGLTLGTSAIALPAAFGLIVTAELLVPTLIGAQWSASVRPLQVAAFFTPLAFHLAIICPLLNALGRVDVNLRITLWMGLVTAPAVVVGASWGILGVAVAAGLAFAAVGVWGVSVAWRMIGLRLGEVARTVLPVGTATAGLVLTVLGVSMLLPPEWPPLVRLLLQIASGAVGYAGWGLGLHRVTLLRQWGSLRATWALR